MKSINVKKLVALTAGALVAGAPFAQALSDDANLPTEKSWYTNAAIVIGANAKPIDVVWAGNIAAAIGQMAFKEEEKTVEVAPSADNVKVKLSVPGEIIVGGEGRTVDTVAFDIGGQEVTTALYATSDDVASLKTAEEVTYEVKSGDEWQEKTYYVTTKVALNNVNVENYEGELRATVSGYPKFETELSGVVGFNAVDNNTASYVDGDNFKYITFDVAGKTYKLTKVVVTDLDTGAGTIGTVDVLVEIATSTSEATVYNDQTVDLGDGYSLKLVDVDKDNKQALVEITTPDGTTFSDVLKYNEATDFDGKLPFKIIMKDFFAGTTTSYIKLGLKADTKTFNFTLNDNGTATAEVDYLAPEDGWKLRMTISDVDSAANAVDVSIDKIELYYTGDENGTYTSLDKGWKVGESIFFPGSEYGVTFGGFKAATMKSGELGSSVVAIDPSGKVYETSLRFERTSMSVPTTGENEYTITNFINGKNLKVYVDSLGTIKLDTDFREDTPAVPVNDGDVVGFNFDDDADADVYFKVTITTPSTGIKNLYLDFAGDGYVKPGTYAEAAAPGTMVPVYLAGAGKFWLVSGTADSLDIDYTGDGVADLSLTTAGPVTLYVYPSAGNLVVSTTAPAAGPYMAIAADVDLGAGATDDESLTITGVSMYKPAALDFVSSVYVDAANSATAEYDTMVFGDMDGKTIEVPVKTREVATGVWTLDKVDAVEKKVVWSDGTNNYAIDADDATTEPDFMYTEWGSEVKAYADKVEIKVPTEQRYLKFFLGKPAKTVEMSDYIEASVGETVRIGDMEVKVEGIEGLEPVTETYKEYMPDMEWSPEIVYLDTELPATYDKIIVVGGHMVNEVASMLVEAGVVEEVAAEGEYVVKKVDYEGKEYIAVWGYTAADTAKAAKEFIQFLRESVMGSSEEGM